MRFRSVWIAKSVILHTIPWTWKSLVISTHELNPPHPTHPSRPTQTRYFFSANFRLFKSFLFFHIIFLIRLCSNVRLLPRPLPSGPLPETHFFFTLVPRGLDIRQSRRWSWHDNDDVAKNNDDDVDEKRPWFHPPTLSTPYFSPPIPVRPACWCGRLKQSTTIVVR